MSRRFALPVAVALTAGLFAALMPAGSAADGDKYGQIKVQFHWDPSAGRAEQAAQFNAGLEIAIDADGAADVQHANGTLQYRQSDLSFVARLAEEGPNRPFIIGSVHNGRLQIERLVLSFASAAGSSRQGSGELARVVVSGVGRDVARPSCDRGRRCPAGAEIRVEGRDGATQQNGWYVSSPNVVLTARG